MNTAKEKMPQGSLKVALVSIKRQRRNHDGGLNNFDSLF